MTIAYDNMNKILSQRWRMHDQFTTNKMMFIWPAWFRIHISSYNIVMNWFLQYQRWKMFNKRITVMTTLNLIFKVFLHMLGITFFNCIWRSLPFLYLASPTLLHIEALGLQYSLIMFMTMFMLLLFKAPKKSPRRLFYLFYFEYCFSLNRMSIDMYLNKLKAE